LRRAHRTCAHRAHARQLTGADPRLTPGLRIRSPGPAFACPGGGNMQRFWSIRPVVTLVVFAAAMVLAHADTSPAHAYTPHVTLVDNDARLIVGQAPFSQLW